MQHHKEMPCLPFSDRFNPVLDILERWASREPTATALVSIGSQGQLVQVQTAADAGYTQRRKAHCSYFRFFRRKSSISPRTMTPFQGSRDASPYHSLWVS